MRNWKKAVFILFLAIFLIFITQLSKASEDPTYEELLKEIKSLKNRVTELEKKLASQITKTQTVPVVTTAENAKKDSPVIYEPGEGLTIKPMDLNIQTHATGILQGTPNANNVGAGEDSQFDASWKVCFEINKKFYDWGHAFMELELGQGTTIVDELNLFSNVNNNASDTGANVLASKFWYSHYFFDKQFNVTCGKLDPTDWLDQNVFADDDSTQFLGSIFDNCRAVEWPSDNAFGVNVNTSFEPIDFFEFDLTYCEADADWEDIIDHGFYAAQVTFKPASLFGWDSDMWEGNYRFYSWLNSRYHAKIVTGGSSATDTKYWNYGFGGNFDQRLTDVFGIFGRLGWQRSDIVPADGGPTLEWTWIAGAQMTGKYWNRENDVLACAVGQLFPSDEYGDAGNPDSPEGHAEIYYTCQVTKYLSLGPDFQIIWNPNGVGKSSEGDDDTIFVYGVRAFLSF